MDSISPPPLVLAPDVPDAPVQRDTAQAAAALKPRLQNALGWFGRSLGRRFVTMSLGLLLIVQLTSFFVIDASLNRHALSALPEQLAMGSRTTGSMLQWRSQRLIEGARLLATDYGFRAAVQSNDRETIASVLANHGARIGASEVALLGTDLSLVALTEGNVWNPESDGPAVARLVSHDPRLAGTSEVTVVNGMPRQMVLVPLKAPMLVGWVVMYFPLAQEIAGNIRKLSPADLTVVSRERPSDPWKVAISGLTPALAGELAHRPWLADGAEVGTGAEMVNALLDGRRFAVHPLLLTPPDAAGSRQPEVLALLSISVDEAVRPPRDLQFALLVTTLLSFLAFGLGSAYTARRVTNPLQSLAVAVERFGAGDALTPITSSGSQDEVRELARVFEQMRMSLAAKQAQIVQSEKLASIGQLAAGVAHEINNPIGFVFSNFGTLEDYLARLFKMLAAYREEEPALEGTPAALRLTRLREEIELEYLEEDIPALMNESKDGIKRVRKIVQDLKDFSHVDARQDWEAIDLHRGLDSTLNIVSNEIKYKADVVKEYGALPHVECLPNELNQVFMNLLVNAAHAIGDERGTITLRTGTGHIAALGASGADAEVWVEVIDTGSGIAPDDLKRIFDPFFTTKPVGKGTGLGLSLSYGIVKKHGGRIEVASQRGRGTTFRVTVPTHRTASPPL